MCNLEGTRQGSLVWGASTCTAMPHYPTSFCQPVGQEGGCRCGGGGQGGGGPRLPGRWHSVPSAEACRQRPKPGRRASRRRAACRSARGAVALTAWSQLSSRGWRGGTRHRHVARWSGQASPGTVMCAIPTPRCSQLRPGRPRDGGAAPATGMWAGGAGGLAAGSQLRMGQPGMGVHTENLKNY